MYAATPKFPSIVHPSVTWLQFLSVELNALSSHDRYTKGFIMFKNVFETDSIVGMCDNKGSWFCYSALIGIRKASIKPPVE